MGPHLPSLCDSQRPLTFVVLIDNLCIAADEPGDSNTVHLLIPKARIALPSCGLQKLELMSKKALCQIQTQNASDIAIVSGKSRHGEAILYVVKILIKIKQADLHGYFLWYPIQRASAPLYVQNHVRTTWCNPSSIRR